VRDRDLFRPPTPAARAVWHRRSVTSVTALAATPYPAPVIASTAKRWFICDRFASGV